MSRICAEVIRTQECEMLTTAFGKQVLLRPAVSGIPLQYRREIKSQIGHTTWQLVKGPSCSRLCSAVREVDPDWVVT